MPLDPYRQWLEIEHQARPLSFYQLLGVSQEANRAELEAAYRERMQIVRRYQVGAHMEVAQRLITELSEAYVCLTDAEKKQAYDAASRGRPLPILECVSKNSPAVQVAAPLPRPQPLTPIVRSHVAAPRRNQRRVYPALLLGSAAALGAIGLIWSFNVAPSSSPTSPPRSKPPMAPPASPKAPVPEKSLQPAPNEPSDGRPPVEAPPIAVEPSLTKPLSSIRAGMVFDGVRTNSFTRRPENWVVTFTEVAGGKLIGTAESSKRSYEITGGVEGDRVHFTLWGNVTEFEYHGSLVGESLDMTFDGKDRQGRRIRGELKLKLKDAAPSTAPGSDAEQCGWDEVASYVSESTGLSSVHPK